MEMTKILVCHDSGVYQDTANVPQDHTDIPLGNDNQTVVSVRAQLR